MAKKFKPIRKVTKKARNAVNEVVVDKAVDSVVNKYIGPEEIIAQVIKLPDSARRIRCREYHLQQVCRAALQWRRQYLQI